MDNHTPEGRMAHEAQFEVYQDWYFNQVDNGLADSTVDFNPYEWVSDTVCEILVVDQSQADSYISMAYALADRIQYPLSSTVVDYTN